MQLVGIIDIGYGNTGSVSKAVYQAGRFVKKINKPEDFQGCNTLIIPGVGNSASFLKKLTETKLDLLIRREFEKGTKIIGICLGLQIMGHRNEESKSKGLCLLPFDVVENIAAGISHSHTGWLDISEHDFLKQEFKAERVYFNHRYSCLLHNAMDTHISYIGNAISHIQYNGFIGMQYHPEKSQSSGIKILKKILGES